MVGGFALLVEEEVLVDKVFDCFSSGPEDGPVWELFDNAEDGLSDEEGAEHERWPFWVISPAGDQFLDRVDAPAWAHCELGLSLACEHPDIDEISGDEWQYLLASYGDCHVHIGSYEAVCHCEPLVVYAEPIRIFTSDHHN